MEKWIQENDTPHLLRKVRGINVESPLQSNSNKGSLAQSPKSLAYPALAQKEVWGLGS
jgi:hypothetical protein